jgi:hypothetical protein
MEIHPNPYKEDNMDIDETTEVYDDTETPEEDEGSYLTAGLVFLGGLGTGLVARSAYGKVKETVLTRLEARRAAKTQEITPAPIEATAAEAE